MKKKSLPVLSEMCATCPFRPGSPYADLAGTVAEGAKHNGRICHSTGKPTALCRGARNLQLKRFARMKFIRAATDEAWAEKCKEMGLTPPEIITL